MIPPFSRPLLSHLRHPTALSLFGLSFPFSRSSSSLPSSVRCTRYLIRQPSPAATRECPTPVILIRALGLTPGKEKEELWTDWSSMFAEKGYTAVEIDITIPSPTPASPFGEMTKALASQIRLLAIPFPPILVSEGRSNLLAQSYIGDNPASGLVMLNPPSDSDPRPSSEKSVEGCGWEWPSFNYEPRFPILILAGEGKLGSLREGSRVMRAAEGGVGRGGKGVSVEVMKEGDERREGTRVVGSPQRSILVS